MEIIVQKFEWNDAKNGFVYQRPRKQLSMFVPNTNE